MLCSKCEPVHNSASDPDPACLCLVSREGTCPSGVLKRLFRQLVSVHDDAVSNAALSTLCLLVGGGQDPILGALALLGTQGQGSRQ